MNLKMLCLSALLTQVAQAFPPAPGFTISGQVRNQFGWLLEADAEAVVVVRQGGVEVARGSVGNTLSLSKNFQILIPLDVRASDAYSDSARPPGVQFTMEVEMGDDVFPITDLSVTERLISSVGGKVVVDFSIAEDTDDDGIPDTWELWQLAEAGISGPDSSELLDQLSREGDFDGDGSSDYQEYLAGTFSFLATESLSLEIAELADWISFNAFLVVGKKYRLEMSSDLRTWERILVRISGETETRIILSVSDSGPVTLETERVSAGGGRHFRLKVQ